MRKHYVVGNNPCVLQLATGTGNAVLSRWYFDSASTTCRAYTYTGINGNENNFLSLADCRRICPGWSFLMIFKNFGNREEQESTTHIFPTSSFMQTKWNAVALCSSIRKRHTWVLFYVCMGLLSNVCHFIRDTKTGSSYWTITTARPAFAKKVVRHISQKKFRRSCETKIWRAHNLQNLLF